MGLAEALERLCDGFAGRTRIDVRRSIATPASPLPAAVESACYRVAQEALTNVARHADARAVSLRLALGPGRLTLEVEDDGRGFDATRPSAGRGLAGIRERVEVLSGAADITSAPGRGARVRIELPLAPEAST